MSDKMTPIVAKVAPQEKDRFFEATELIGTTPSNAIRMFICAFNRSGTFPFEITAPETQSTKHTNAATKSKKGTGGGGAR